MILFYSKNLFKIISIITTRLYNALFLKRKIHWNIAYFKSNLYQIDIKKIFVIKNPRNRWFADPFFIRKKKKDYIFFEDYNMIKKFGSISCVEVGKDDSLKFYKNIIKEKFHMSFPFLLNFNKNLYMIPETVENNAIKLYKCVKFPNKWVFVKDLLKDINCVDTIIFKQNKFWYLITCTMSKNNVYNVLEGYYTKNPIIDNWKKIKKNPLTAEYTGERNGGLIFDKKNNIYRVGQIYLPGMYGYGFTINKLLKISKNNYSEVSMKNNFNNLNDLKHVHTINSKNNFTVIDFSEWK